MTATDPLRLTLGPVGGNVLAVRVDNPSGEAFRGLVRLVRVDGIDPARTTAGLELQPGEKQKDVVFPLAEKPVKFQLGLRVENEKGRTEFEMPLAKLAVVDDFGRYQAASLQRAYDIIPDGDAKIGSQQSIAPADAPPGLPGRVSQVLEIRYRMDQGWKFLRLAPQSNALKKIEGLPRALGLWVYGDGSGNGPRLRVVDATGQTLQPAADSITWTGWRYVEFSLDGSRSGHWGGADDSQVHWPIRFDTLFLLDGMRKATSGRVYIAGPVLIYTPIDGRKRPAK